MKTKIYLDSASTTYVNGEVLMEMLPAFDSVFANANSLHTAGREATALVDTARDRVAKAFNCKPSEIYFTSGGTEANNWAIQGIAYANKKVGNHIITSQIEHPSILEACKQLEKRGFKVTYLPVDKYGLVNLAELLHHMNHDTILVSIMTANNEVGTIQHINAIARSVREKGIIFHTDAVQAVGSFKIDVNQLEVDAITVSSHKLYGPKGAGALYVRKGVKIEPFIAGGSQEHHKRAGTVNVPAVVGFGKAIEVSTKNMTANVKKLKSNRDYFLRKLRENIEGVHLNGHRVQRLPHIVNVSFDFIEGESVMLMLDLEGIAVSTGSACASGSLDQSHVLVAMGVHPELANGAVRFSFTTRTSKKDIDYVVEKLVTIVKRLRAISPLTKRTRKKGAK